MVYQLTANLTLNNTVTNLRPVIANIRKELASVGMLNINANISPAILNQITSIKTNLQALQQTAQSVGSTLAGIGRGNTHINNIANSTRNMGNQWMYAEKSVNGFNESMNHAISRLASYTMGYVALHKVISLASNAMKELSEFQNSTQLAYSQMTGNAFSSSATNSFTNNVRSSAIRYGTSSTELGKSSALIGSSGISTEQLEKLVPLLAKLSKVQALGGLAQTNDVVIGLARGMNMGASDIEKTMNSLLTTTTHFGVEASNIIQVIKLNSAEIRQVNGDLETLMGLTATLRQNTRLPQEMIATGIKTITSNLYGKQSTLSTLHHIGVESFDQQGNAVAPMLLINQIADKLNKMDDKTKTETLMSIAGGARQIAVAQSLFNPSSISTLNESYTLAKGGRDSGLVNNNAEMSMETISSKLQVMTERFNQLAEVISKNKVITTVASGLGLLVSKLLDLGHTINSLLPALSVGGVGLMGASVIGQGHFYGGSNPIGPTLPFRQRFNSMNRIRDTMSRGATRIGRGGAFGIGLGMELGSEYFSGDTTGSALAKGGLQGVGTGLMVGSTLGPLAGTIAGTVTAFNTLAESTNEATKAFKGLSGEAVGKAIHNFGAGSKEGLTAYDEQQNRINSERTRGLLAVSASEKRLGGWLGRGFRAGYGTITGEEETTREAISQKERQTIMNKSGKLSAEQQQTAMDALKEVAGKYTSKSDAMGNMTVREWLKRSGAEGENMLNSMYVPVQKELGSVRGSGVSSQIREYNDRFLTASHLQPLGARNPNYASYLEGGIGSTGYGKGLSRAGIDNPILTSANRASTNLTGQIERGLSGSLSEMKNAIQTNVVGESDVVQKSVKEHLDTISSLEQFKKEVEDTTKFVSKLLSGQGLPELATSAHKVAQSLDLIHQKQQADFSYVLGLRQSSMNATMGVGHSNIALAELQQQLSEIKRVPIAGMGNSLVNSTVGGMSISEIGRKMGEAQKNFSESGDSRYKQIYDTLSDKLKLLGDSALRLKNSFEQLEFYQRSKTAKLGLVQSFYEGDMSSRVQMGRDMRYASLAVAKGNLGGMTIPQQQGAIRMLNGPLAGINNVANTGMNGKELLDKILTKTVGGQFLKPEQSEIDKIKDGMISVMKDSNRAQVELANQEGQAFFQAVNKMDSNNEKFLQGLGIILNKPHPMFGQQPLEWKNIVGGGGLPNVAVGGVGGGGNAVGGGVGGKHKIHPFDQLRKGNGQNFHDRRQENRDRFQLRRIEGGLRAGREWDAETMEGADRARNRLNGIPNEPLKVGFDQQLNKLDNVLKNVNIPSKINVEVGQVEHVVKVNGESSLASAIVGAIHNRLTEIVGSQMRNAINPLTGETSEYQQSYV